MAGGKSEDFPIDDNDTEAFNILFRYSKGLPRDAIKVGDELLKHLVGNEARKATLKDVEEVAIKTLKKGRYKTDNGQT